MLPRQLYLTKNILHLLSLSLRIHIHVRASDMKHCYRLHATIRYLECMCLTKWFEAEASSFRPQIVLELVPSPFQSSRADGASVLVTAEDA